MDPAKVDLTCVGENCGLFVVCRDKGVLKGNACPYPQKEESEKASV